MKLWIMHCDRIVLRRTCPYNRLLNRNQKSYFDPGNQLPLDLLYDPPPGSPKFFFQILGIVCLRFSEIGSFSPEFLCEVIPRVELSREPDSGLPCTPSSLSRALAWNCNIKVIRILTSVTVTFGIHRQNFKIVRDTIVRGNLQSTVFMFQTKRAFSIGIGPVMHGYWYTIHVCSTVVLRVWIWICGGWWLILYELVLRGAVLVLHLIWYAKIFEQTC